MLEYKKVPKGAVVMKIKKNKIIAIVVAIVLIVSVFIVGSVANTKNTSVAITVDKTKLFAGETATVTVKASADYPVATTSIPVFYDKTLVSVSNATATLTDYEVSNVTTDVTATDTSKVYANTGIDNSKFGFVLVTYIGGANAEVPATLEDTTVLTFTITALADVSGEALIKCVTESAKTDENIEGMLYFGTTTSGTTITSIPENVENINVASASASVTLKIGTSTDSILVAAEGKDTVVDSTNKYIYGITPGDSVEDYIAVNGGSYEIVANSSGKTNGTGTTVNVKNSSGTIVDTYTVIIFGDVNGDAEVTATDVAIVMTVTVGGTIEDYAYNFAADVNGDSSITATDSATVSNASLGGDITTNPYA